MKGVRETGPVVKTVTGMVHSAGGVRVPVLPKYGDQDGDVRTTGMCTGQGCVNCREVCRAGQGRAGAATAVAAI